MSRKTILHGDRIRIGSSEFVFLTGADETALGRSPSGGHEDSSGFVTVALDRSGMPTDASWVGRMARDLSAFFKIANVINSTRDALALQRELLALISEVIPAAQGAIVLQPNSNEEPSAPCIWNRKGSLDRRCLFGRSWCNRRPGNAAPCSRRPGLTRLRPSMCCACPWPHWRESLGVIYLSSPASSPAFQEDHAYFLSSVSRIAAVTLESLFELDSLRAENQRLRAEVKADGTLIGESRPMLRVSGVHCAGG